MTNSQTLQLARQRRSCIRISLEVLGSFCIILSLFIGRNELQPLLFFPQTNGEKDSSSNHSHSAISLNDFHDRQRQDLIDCRIRKRCNLYDKYLGVPTVLVSQGRSGSSATWQLMSSMTGNYTFNATEDTGSGTKQSKRFFERIDPEEDGKCWILRLLCYKQKKNRLRAEEEEAIAGIYGFKWKPVTETFGSKKAKEALQWLSQNPHIKVVHSKRNPIDVFISRHKHHNQEVGAHCIVGDVGCLQEHERAQKRMKLPVEQELIDGIERIVSTTENATQILNDSQVPHVDVTYEKLYYADDIAIEWRRIFSFLGTGLSGKDLSSYQLKSHMAHVATSNHSMPLSDKLQNYDEVAETLMGTAYEKFLY